jgi:hypothetical protein
MSFSLSSHPVFTGFQRKMRELRQRWKEEATLHPAIRRYIDFCREMWPRDYPVKVDSVVLVGLFDWNSSVHCYAHVTNHLARKTGSTIEWFYFYRRRNLLYEKIFAAFGARQGLSMDGLRGNRQAAEEIAGDLFAKLETKSDVANLSLGGIQIGDLIYDTYLRAGFHPTVKIDDPSLREIMVHAVQIYLGVKEYLARKQVVSVIADHTVYIYCGIMARMAAAAGIPVYQIYYGADFHIIKIELDRAHSDVPLRYPWPRYAELFRELSPETQAMARVKGRASLEARLEGKKDGVLLDATAYGATDGKPVFEQTGRPRVLVLLNDFFDSVHGYRWMLFPDFYEWIHFLLEKAGETPFDWYVKPHPNMLIWEKWDRLGQAEANKKVLDELRAKFPKVHFLSPSVSNRQIMAEGLDALFTVHGTAGHEFAYRGIPVVNAGDNQHIAYSFNLHARTIAEYESYIAHANALKVEIRREEIAEYVYMNFFYFLEQCRADANPIPASYFETEEYREQRSRPETFDAFTEPLSVTEKTKLDAYFDRAMPVAVTHAG